MTTRPLPVAPPGPHAGRSAGKLASLVLLAAGALAGGCQWVAGSQTALGLVEDKAPYAQPELADLNRKAAERNDAATAAYDKAHADEETDKGFHLTTFVEDHSLGLLAPPKAPPPPVESLVIRADGLVAEKEPREGSVEARLAGARELYRQGEYAKAESLYRRLAENQRNPEAVVQEARFYEAECLRLQGYYPKAADVYMDLMSKHPRNPYREQCVQRTFDIANYWLDDTREEMREAREAKDGKRWVVWPRFVSFERTKPLLDREGRAIEKLEQVRYNDITGPLADRALFLAGSVKFYNGDYREADHYFSQIHERHPNSPLAAQAVEFAIISKHLSTGGPDYDGRKSAEARKLVDAALNNYPELAGKKREFLEQQVAGITLQQAAKDFNTADFYRRTGHPGPAYWYFGLVVQRYPTTDYAKQAKKHMEELEAEMQKKNGGVDLRTPAPAAQPAPVTAGAPAAPAATPAPPRPPDAVETAPPAQPLPGTAQPPRQLPPSLTR
jgi:outer membrane protein assembly factor BamD (BamD/ComL family)